MEVDDEGYMKRIMASHFQELQECGSRTNSVKDIFFLDLQGYLLVTKGCLNVNVQVGMFGGGQQVIVPKK